MTLPAKIDIAASHQTRLGCSKIAQALGLSRWGTTYELWEMYTGKAPWPDIGNQLRVALGEPMEDVLRPFVAERLGRVLGDPDSLSADNDFVGPCVPLNERQGLV